MPLRPLPAAYGTTLLGGALAAPSRATSPQTVGSAPVERTQALSPEDLERLLAWLRPSNTSVNTQQAVVWLNEHPQVSRTPLLLKLFENNLGAVRALVAHQAIDLNAREHHGMTIAHQLLSLRHQKYLVRAQALFLDGLMDPNATGVNGRTLLVQALCTGCLAAANTLLNVGANPNQPDPTHVNALPVVIGLRQGVFPSETPLFKRLFAATTAWDHPSDWGNVPLYDVVQHYATTYTLPPPAPAQPQAITQGQMTVNIGPSSSSWSASMAPTPTPVGPDEQHRLNVVYAVAKASGPQTKGHRNHDDESIAMLWSRLRPACQEALQAGWHDWLMHEREGLLSVAQQSPSVVVPPSSTSSTLKDVPSNVAAPPTGSRRRL